MKVKYSYDYINRQYKTPEALAKWASERAGQLKDETGVTFEFSLNAYSYRFTPVITEDIQEISEHEILEKVLSACKNMRYLTDFNILALDTGLPLKTVVGAAKWLVGHQYALTGKINNRIFSIRWWPGACKVYLSADLQENENWHKTRLVRSISDRNLRRA